jgi:signal transduction histidine kinase
LSILYLLELRLIGKQIEAGGRISEFFDVTLEIRRFEKNFFLYRQPGDLRENAEYLGRARQLLDENRLSFSELAPSTSIAKLRRKLDEYGARMATYAESSRPATDARDIRALGLDIVNHAQALAEAERAALQRRLDQHRHVLLATLAGLLALLALAAAVVSRGIVRPLKEMETSMEAIATGSTDRLSLSARDREIVSLVAAFNHVLDEIRLRQQQQLIQADRLASLGRLISGVAHEVNNPLSNISTSAQILLEDEGGSDPVWRREMLTQIDDETVRAQRIVRSLLDYAREREFRREPVPLRATVEETLRFIRNEIPAQVSVHLDIPDSLLIHADKPRLQQVFLNLLKNAVEAVEGAGEIYVGAVCRTADDPGAPSCLRDRRCGVPGAEVVDIEVRDDGPGIPPDVLPHVFEPFFSTKEASRGSGLGLFIVREIVEEHGGCIAAESEPGRYTAFHIRLPQTANDSMETR